MTGPAIQDLLGYMAAFRATYHKKVSLIPEHRRSHLAHLRYLSENYHAELHASEAGGAGFQLTPGAGPDRAQVGPQRLHFLAYPYARPWAPENIGLSVASGGNMTVVDSGFASGVSAKISADSDAFFARVLWNDAVPVFAPRQTSATYTIMDSEVRVGGWRRERIHFAHYVSTLPGEMPYNAVRGEIEATDAILSALAQVNIDESTRIDHFADRILLLGDFSPSGRERLEQIKTAIAAAGYSSFLVEEVGDLPAAGVDAKVQTLILTSRFVVVDDSSPAGQLAEIPLLSRGRTPSLVLRLEGTFSSSMSRTAGGPGSSLLEMDYTTSSLNTQIAQGLRKLEALREEQRIYVTGAERWRERRSARGDFTRILGLADWFKPPRYHPPRL